MKLARHIFLLAALALALSAAAITPPDTPRAFRQSVRTIAVPVFVNQTQTYRIEQILYARRCS